MRHVRMLGLCLAAVCALSAMTAGQALAKKEACYHYVDYGACETPKEHATYQYFANCPVHAPSGNPDYLSMEEGGTCLGAESFYKEHWQSNAEREEWERAHERPAPGLKSYFTAGKVTVPLKYSITLRGGVEDLREEDENLELPTFLWVGAVGAPTIQPVAQPAVSLTKGVNKALLSTSELERFDYYTKIAKIINTTATVELAGSAEELRFNLRNLLAEEGVAFSFPVKVHLSNPFLGEDCYVGSNENPIIVPFTSGQAGALHGKTGLVSFGDPVEEHHENNDEILRVWGDTLVTDSFSSPGVENCGVDGGADEAIDSALGLPSATGNSSVLNGYLLASGVEGVAEHLAGG